MELSGKRIAILTEDHFDEQEFIYANLRMREAGATVTIVAPRGGHEYKSKAGWPNKSDQAASDVRAADFDAVIVPGGYAPDRMRRDPAMVRLVREAVENGKIVAAICHAGWILVTAGVLAGRTVTGFFSLEPELRGAGAEYVDREVV
ncbi:MAG TPA: type 1 glutamine amidotransferase domain-containing protein, partial [Chloroflexia bacterium]|nr:type 1 glutamine amidotransferase domain-containing protein [Chloroflexia bacterium]